MAKILIVDDDPFVLELFVCVLSHKGYDVVSATNGVEGLGRYQSCEPDVVVTDLYMPKKNGIQMITEIRQHSPDVPILALSGGGSDPDVSLDNALKCGASRILSKPVDNATLIACIEELTGVVVE